MTSGPGEPGKVVGTFTTSTAPTEKGSSSTIKGKVTALSTPSSSGGSPGPSSANTLAGKRMVGEATTSQEGISQEGWETQQIDNSLKALGKASKSEDINRHAQVIVQGTLNKVKLLDKDISNEKNPQRKAELINEKGELIDSMLDSISSSIVKLAPGLKEVVGNLLNENKEFRDNQIVKLRMQSDGGAAILEGKKPDKALMQKATQDLDRYVTAQVKIIEGLGNEIVDKHGLGDAKELYLNRSETSKIGNMESLAKAIMGKNKTLTDRVLIRREINEYSSNAFKEISHTVEAMNTKMAELEKAGKKEEASALKKAKYEYVNEKLDLQKDMIMFLDMPNQKKYCELLNGQKEGDFAKLEEFETQKNWGGKDKFILERSLIFFALDRTERGEYGKHVDKLNERGTVNLKYSEDVNKRMQDAMDMKARVDELLKPKKELG